MLIYFRFFNNTHNPCLIPCPCTGEQRRLLEGNPGRQPEMPPTTMTVAWESLEVIANQEESETVDSQWNLRSDGSLELPASPIPGANFFLQVRASNGTCVRIPVATAACVSGNVPL